MAQAERMVSLSPGTWVELTGSDTTILSFQIHFAEREVYIKPTSGSAPSSRTGSLMYKSGDGEVDITLANIFRGASSTVRLFAYSDGAGSVSVTHN